MSQVDVFEKKIRYSVAISMLNEFRHWLIGRTDKNLSKEDKELLIGAINIHENKELLFDEMIKYSFYEVGNVYQASRLELSEALNAVVREDSSKTRTEILKSIKEYINLTKREEIDETEIELATSLVVDVMHELDSQNNHNITSQMDVYGV
ncbi:hypothetical protein MBAV_000491 [Candidatus Magnetobacterium bavaricum]|uniref:Uncharacterized protein n=1 Tax=Candidatus Magnetobacterium bavaricum TaxID=29290 RepID=A0A0F3H320_9BACT|nr:hypothetical protein MBAV_000491 [Candidatus Magnetobacterium bavaricum]